MTAPPEGRRRLSVVVVEDVTPPADRPIELGLRADMALRQALQAPSSFEPAAHGDPMACKANAQVAYAFMRNGAPVKAADSGSARLGIIAEAYCPRGKEVETYRVEVDDEAGFGGAHGSTGGEALEGLLSKLAARTAEALYGQVSMRHGRDSEVLAALAGDARPGVLMEAASEAGERKLVGAVPELVRLTRHAEEMVQLRAGAALGHLGDPREEVLRALAVMTEGSSMERHLVAVNALGDLGGTEAARYLDTLAVGHPSVPLRDLAREAARRARGESELPDPPEPGKMPPANHQAEER